MPSKDFGEDAAFLLYLAPVVISIIYGAVQWAVTAKSSTMPVEAYLIVAKSPYLFLVSLAAILLAIILEVRSTETADRSGIVEANIRRLQILAVIVLIVSFLAALDAGGFNFIETISLFVNGRYPIIYSFFLIGLSLLLAPREVFGNLRVSSLPDLLGMLLVVGAPVLFYLGIRVHLDFAACAFGSLIVGIIGLVLLLNEKMLAPKKPAQQPQQKQPVSTGVVTPKQAPENTPEQKA